MPSIGSIQGLYSDVSVLLSILVLEYVIASLLNVPNKHQVVLLFNLFGQPSFNFVPNLHPVACHSISLCSMHQFVFTLVCVGFLEIPLITIFYC